MVGNVVVRPTGILMLLAVLLSVQGCASVKPTGKLTVEGRPISHAVGGQGSPTIVLEAGLGNGMDSWATIYPDLTKLSTVFAYDRPGYGGSQTKGERLSDFADWLPGSELLTVGQILGPNAPAVTGAMVASHLDQLLTRKGLAPPYILVGHSAGGQYMLIYAARYPEKVAGIVLVDSRPKGFTAECQRRGLSPCEVPGMLRALSPTHVQAEIDGLAATDAQTPAPSVLDAIPVTRLVATEYSFTLNAAFHGLWVEMQTAEAKAQRHGRLQLVEGAGHDIMVDRPETVMAAIRDMVTEARSKLEAENSQQVN